MSLEREHKAWIICGCFKATATRGPLGPFPMYQDLGKTLPFFTKQRYAREYCRERGMKVPGPLGIHFIRVTVKSAPDHPRRQ
jgi:hypothetical protein